MSLEFEESVSASSFALQFQGGFCGKDCEVEVNGENKVLDFYPEDANKTQTFQFPEPLKDVKKMRIIFNSSTDFYGRITLYMLDLYS